jgi:hypothetical protein
MNRIVLISILLIVAFSLSACKPKSSPQTVEQSQPETTVQNTAPDETSQSQPSPTPPTEQTTENDNEKSVFDLFVPEAQKTLSYNGYTLTKTSKKIWVKEVRTDAPMTVPYSVLKRKGQIIKRFEYNDSSLTIPDFGWLNSSGEQSKHLIVGQIEPRIGRFWVISLLPYYRVLFDSEDFGGSRQELWLEDIDKDGTYELGMVTFGCTSIGLPYNLLCTPQPVIIFKYDKKADKYLPANHMLQSYALAKSEKHIGQLKTTSEQPSITDNQAVEPCVYFREMTDIFLGFIYAGKEHQAWAFFDKYYNLPNKNKLKASMKKDLRKDPIYRFIYRRQTKNHA